MKLKYGLALAFTMLTGLAVIAGENNIEHVFDVVPGTNLSVKNINGKIRVSVWDRDKVEIVAVKKGHGRKSQQKMEFVDVEMSQDGDQILVETIQRKRSTNISVYYEIRVPKQMMLALYNTNGKIVVEGVSGHVLAQTTNGGISLSEIAGSLEAESTNGSISAELLSHDGNKIRCRTTNGSITLDVPDNIQAELNARYTNGNVHTRLAMDRVNKGKRFLEGSFNGGGAGSR